MFTKSSSAPSLQPAGRVPSCPVEGSRSKTKSTDFHSLHPSWESLACLAPWCDVCGRNLCFCQHPHYPLQCFPCFHRACSQCLPQTCTPLLQHWQSEFLWSGQRIWATTRKVPAFQKAISLLDFAWAKKKPWVLLKAVHSSTESIPPISSQ